MQTRVYGRVNEVVPVPNLKDLQVKSYKSFLQLDRTPQKRDKSVGLEQLLSEIFPIKSYDEKTTLSYLHYELKRPRYTAEECRRLRLSYGMPFHIRIRLVKDGEDAIEDPSR